ALRLLLPRARAEARAVLRWRAGPGRGRGPPPRAGGIRATRRCRASGRGRPTPRASSAPPRAASGARRRRAARSRSRWLPQLEAVSLDVVRPGESSVLHLLDLVVDVDTPRAELREHGVEIANAEVDHQLLSTRPEITGVR